MELATCCVVVSNNQSISGGYCYCEKVSVFKQNYKGHTFLIRGNLKFIEIRFKLLLRI